MKIKELLSSPDKWTTGAYARTKDGFPVTSTCNEAVCWCLVGAAMRCYGNIDDYYRVINLIGRNFGYDSQITTRNDGSTYEEIYKLVSDLDI